jgi:hypothetical protein
MVATASPQMITTTTSHSLFLPPGGYLQQINPQYFYPKATERTKEKEKGNLSTNTERLRNN